MSQLVELLNKSTKPRPEEARQIPTVAVNFFDRQGDIQKGFVPFEALRTTEYTDKALQYYNTQRTNMVTPLSFKPTESGINLDRYSPDNNYYKPGTPGTEGGTGT